MLIACSKHCYYRIPKIKEELENSGHAILVLNFRKNKDANYISGAIFMEIIKAWELEKKYIYNQIQNNKYFKDELTAINPVISDRDLFKIK